MLLPPQKAFSKYRLWTLGTPYEGLKQADLNGKWDIGQIRKVFVLLLPILLPGLSRKAGIHKRSLEHILFTIILRAPDPK